MFQRGAGGASEINNSSSFLQEKEKISSCYIVTAVRAGDAKAVWASTK